MRRSLLQDATRDLWLKQFGKFDFPAQNTITVQSGDAVNRLFHAEAHYKGVLGADFEYSATISAEWANRPDLSVHLQFRISDEGRYGVRLQDGTISLYRMMLGDRRCSNDSAVIAHCPLWPLADMQNAALDDAPIEQLLGPPAFFDKTIQTLRVTVVAEGSRFIVSFGTDSQVLGRREIQDIEHGIGIGRFGIYALAKQQELNVRFSDVAATTDPTAASNFTLLYSTPGYDLDGTKRALVRTVNDIDAQDYDDASSTFTVTNTCGEVKIHDRNFQVSGGGGRSIDAPVVGGFRRTLGFQFLVADFSDLQEAGHYTLEARLVTPGGIRVLRSRPFEIIPRLVTERMLWPMSILNAKARRAAEDDFRRNWFIDSGHAAWSVGLDGAFVADRADDQGGAVLRRIFNCGNLPLNEVEDFRFVARITIVDGCDAQLQFRITENERWAVTLQAGDAGRCQHGQGPGAVRLHREGRAVENQDHFEVIESHPLDDHPFQVGHAYDVEVRTQGKQIEVMLDDRLIKFSRQVSTQKGAFALKAWGSTVRFEHVKVWARNVGLSRPVPGVWIPFDRASRKSSQGFDITTDDVDGSAGSPSDNELSYPLAAQQHGFHDCNSFIGEVTSHSVFLSSLLDVWATRAHAASPSQQEDLRYSILTAVLYLYELYEQGNRSGTFAHQEPGRTAFDSKAKQVLTTKFAMYGLSAFAEKGAAVDKKLARDAFDLAKTAWDRLEIGGRDIFLDSIVASRMAHAAQREGIPSESWFARAEKNAADVLSLFTQAVPIAKMMRPTLNSIPWFEGVYETAVRGRVGLSEAQLDQVKNIAKQLMELINDPANGFCLIPQASDNDNPFNSAIPEWNWNNLSEVPRAVYSIPELKTDRHPPTYPVGDWYISNHFATAAADCVYIGRLAGDRTLERLATGNLYWILGLNPGIPTTKVVPPAPTEGPWSAASFVYNGPGAFARSFEGDRTRAKAAKGWLAEWEESASSRHREIWAFDPARNGFQTTVNGHVLREGQWHYWSVGPAGWVCAETFMLTDAGFIKAALALEDWHSGSTLVRATPYDVTKLHFFDTTHLDRASTPWLFDDPDRTAAALASRMATDFAGSKGFAAGRLTGHHIGERVGVICLPIPGTTFEDILLSDIKKLRFRFDGINTASWAEAGRAAMELAAQRGAGAGFFTGHQLSGKCGWIGIDGGLVEIFDIDDKTVAMSPWAFTDINTVGWAQAARLATDLCIRFGFAGGFFTGHQVPNKRQIAALRWG